MAFCFNFEVSDNEICNAENLPQSDDFEFDFKIPSEHNPFNQYENIKIQDGNSLPSISTKNFVTEKSKTNIYYYDEAELDLFLKSPDAKTQLSQDVHEALQAQRDVIPGTLEGGFTIWRGSCDLVNYIDSDDSISDVIAGSRVLEAGCGAGLPALYSMKKGAECVHFQDFNRDVITNWTIPNVLLNLSTDSNCKVEFSSGDWLSFTESYYAGRFDLILSAETIYRKENYLKLHTVFDKLLTDDGSVILAAKMKYYAVDGDLNDFLTFIDSKAVFSYKLVNLPYEGVVRCIIILKKKYTS